MLVHLDSPEDLAGLRIDRVDVGALIAEVRDERSVGLLVERDRAAD